MMNLSLICIPHHHLLYLLSFIYLPSMYCMYPSSDDWLVVVEGVVVAVVVVVTASSSK